MRAVRLVGALAVAAALAAQGPAPHWQWLPLPELPVVALGLGYVGGYDTESAVARGVVAVTGELRLQAARAAVPEVLASGISIGPRRSAVWVVVGPERFAQGAEFLRRFTNAVEPGADHLALGVARAALAADDAAWLYPGEVVPALGAVAWFGGDLDRHGRRGSAVALAGLSAPQVQAGLGPLAPAVGVAVGRLPVDPGVVPLPAAVGWTAPAPAWSVAAPSLPVLYHPRVDGPFVAQVFAVPATVDPMALALGLEVARARAAVALPYRPAEAAARLSRITWDWPAAEPLVVFARRGPNHADRAEPERELQRLVAALRQTPPAGPEVAAAAAALGAELGLWPWPAAELARLGAAPEDLGRRLAQHLRAAVPLPHREALSAVSAEAVASAVQGLLAVPPRAVAVLPQAGPAPAGRPVPGRPRDRR